MNGFVHHTRSSRVVFGAGRVDALRDEVERLGASRVHLLAGRRISPTVSPLLGDCLAVHTDTLVQHVPVEEVDRGASLNDKYGVDAYVAVGGGSAIGLAKAFALRHPAPIIAVPTTFSGSEMSAMWGTTSNGAKTTGIDDSIAPRTVIYDPDLLAGLPRAIAVTSSVNAVAHAVEALYAVDGSPLVSLIAEESVRLLGHSLAECPSLSANTASGWGELGFGIGARSAALEGAWLAGICLGSVSMALHHKICHTLGGVFGLPHSDVHTVMLPFVLAYNSDAAPQAASAVARALDDDDPARGLQNLIRRAGGPTNLASLGFGASDIDTAVAHAIAKPYPNPRPVDADGVRSLLVAALSGSIAMLGV
ncbi:hypothetical protein CH267_06535 [Rhodococcus sp. 06-621-2]|nr:maleylacetate reductase [Rhodococcus sp. 06-621-2]OZC59751.1 hypothetical protein CH267_06535 [Rhodococcus sp. 06-621-2]